ncbi:Pyridoxal kinase [Choanephora cucurbitarum]|uniref:pyridoxal kinase n=1 Tax=Choanephora cucurbitarum TaxID=101091 RepID=A0A1C7N7P7_9FUNG|nr:Pyridoxal kinase [Choanephora cucurbitarum]
MTTSDRIDETECDYRVLSIQSHTVSGYCGNKAAVFPLQTLGFEVDILNTVQFSNHTGYPSWTGNRYSAQDVQDLFEGLEANELMDDYTHLLTGYIGNYAILEKIEKMVQKLKTKNSKLIYVCDTVMGDCGQLYVSPEIVPLYRNIMKFADVVTPNQFEAETLTESKIENLDDACTVAKKLHELGSSHVVITSLCLPLKHVPLDVQSESSTDESLYCLTSQALPDGTFDQHLISFPTYQGYFTGTGDLFSSLTVARLQESINNKTSWVDAIERVICSVNAITKNTWLHQKKLVMIESEGQTEVIESKPSAAKLVRSCELRLIQGRKEIEHPELSMNVIKRIKV